MIIVTANAQMKRRWYHRPEGSRWHGTLQFQILSLSLIWALHQLSRERQPSRQQTTRPQSIWSIRPRTSFSRLLSRQQAVQNSDELIYIWSLYTYSYCRSSFRSFSSRSLLSSSWLTTVSSSLHDFQWYFSRTIHDQSDFPGLSRSWNFQEKIQNFPGGVEQGIRCIKIKPN